MHFPEIDEENHWLAGHVTVCKVTIKVFYLETAAFGRLVKKICLPLFMLVNIFFLCVCVCVCVQLEYITLLFGCRKQNGAESP